MIHNLNKPTRGGNVVLKVVIAKAYDRIDSDFLKHVLSSFGFFSKICNLERQCINTPWYFMVINGIMQGFFKDGRGQARRSPISIYIFIIVENVLSRMLRAKFEDGSTRSFSLPRGLPSFLIYYILMIL